ncbi:MAG TPA: PAS domain-containing protein [Beijerinckiaceae bacterium]|nr:PAS domain-containing protein [Beijerinckiaceae bacterium]
MRFESSKHIFAYWRRLRAGATAPERNAIDPVALGRHLADVFLLERDAEGAFRFRLAGSSLCVVFGQELRGREFLSVLTQAAADDGGEILLTATEDQFPVVAGVSVLMADRRSFDAELLVLPLLQNGRAGVMLFGSLAYKRQDRFALGTGAGLEILSFRVIGERDTRHLHPPTAGVVIDGHKGERRGHLVVFNGGSPGF